MSLLKFLTSQTFFKHLGLALVVFLILFYGFTQWLKNTTNHNEFRKVPNLVGKKMDLAKSLLEERDLVLGDVEYKDYDPKLERKEESHISPSNANKLLTIDEVQEFILPSS